MLITNFKVFITKNGDGAITYTNSNICYRVYISKKNEVPYKVFNKHFKQLKPFKNRHYAIAQSITREIRTKGYIFKAYYNNKKNIRPIKKP